MFITSNEHIFSQYISLSDDLVEEVYVHDFLWAPFQPYLFFVFEVHNNFHDQFGHMEICREIHNQFHHQFTLLFLTRIDIYFTCIYFLSSNFSTILTLFYWYKISRPHKT